MHRTTANEPLRIVQQTEGQKGFKPWHAIVRRYDLRIMSDKTSAYAAMISNTSGRDRAKYMEQFDDILRTFINETNKFEKRFGTIRNVEKMLADKKLLLECLLNCRFRETMMSYSELLIAVKTSSLTRKRQSRQRETGRLTRVFRWKHGMAEKDGGESAREEGDQRIVDFALQAGYKGTGKGKWSLGLGLSLNEKGYQGGEGDKEWKRMAKGQWQERKRRARERWQWRHQSMLDVWQDGTHCSVVSKRR